MQLKTQPAQVLGNNEDNSFSNTYSSQLLACLYFPRRKDLKQQCASTLSERNVNNIMKSGKFINFLFRHRKFNGSM